MDILQNIIIFSLGAGLLYFGAEYLISSGVEIAKKFGVSSVVIGITVVAFGTSLPELIVSISANMRGETGIVLGNVIGSNIANIGLVLGTSALITPIIFNFKESRKDLYILGGVTLLFTFFLIPGYLFRIEGIIFILLLLGFCFYLFKKNNYNDVESNKSLPLKVVVLLILGVLGLWLGSELFLMGAIRIAEIFGVSSAVIGMSLVALGTSLPELATSVVAASKGKPEIAVGNIIGSNLFNILAVLGITLFVREIKFEFAEIALNTGIMVFLTILLILFLKLQNGLNRFVGLFLLSLYFIAIYFTISNPLIP